MVLFRCLYYLALFGTVTSSIYCVLVVLGAGKFRRLRLKEEAEVPTYFPPVSLLKPLHGAEQGLAENLKTFFEQWYPEYEILFCARTAEDAGILIAKEIAARYPQVKARFLACGEPQFPNPKMYSLAVMADAAEHDVLVTSDADARITTDYLARCVQSLRDEAMEVASCFYVGTALGSSLATRLDAVGKSVEMTAGCMVAIMLADTDFALGVTMVLRKRAFALAGGYEDLGTYWAEDFVIGNRLAAQRKGVRILSHVIRITVPEVGFAKSFQDQLRWMQSTRRSRPWGHFGTGLTFAVPFGLLALVAGALSGYFAQAIPVFCFTVLTRWVMADLVLRALGAEKRVRDVLIYPLRDAMGGLLWLCSYLPIRSRYHGGKFDITPDGRLTRAIEH